MYSEYVKAYILYAKNRDLQQTQELLINALQKDTNRYDIMIEIMKNSYMMRNYEEAYRYFNRLMEIDKAWNLDVINKSDYLKVGLILAKMGLTEESDKYVNDFKAYTDNNQSIYKHLNLAAYYAYRGDKEKALENLRLFSKQENYQYWIVIFTPIDPVVDTIKDLPEFRKIMNDIETKFWDNHDRIKASLEKKDLI